MFALLGEVISCFPQPSAHVAALDPFTALVNAMSQALASHADMRYPSPLSLSIDDKVKLIHA